MESIQEKEKIKKNVVILGWVLIAIHVFGFYQTMNLTSHAAGFPNSPGDGMQSFQAYFILVISIFGLLIDAAFIFYSWKMINFIEKGRATVSFLMLVQVLVNVGLLLYSIIISLPLPHRGGYPYFTFGFVIAWIKLIVFNGAVIAFYYMTYNFLNKQETKAEFAGMNDNNAEKENGN